jgi:hypothetical protein
MQGSQLRSVKLIQHWESSLFGCCWFHFDSVDNQAYTGSSSDIIRYSDSPVYCRLSGMLRNFNLENSRRPHGLPVGSPDAAWNNTFWSDPDRSILAVGQQLVGKFRGPIRRTLSTRRRGRPDSHVEHGADKGALGGRVERILGKINTAYLNRKLRAGDHRFELG